MVTLIKQLIKNINMKLLTLLLLILCMSCDRLHIDNTNTKINYQYVVDDIELYSNKDNLVKYYIISKPRHRLYIQDFYVVDKSGKFAINDIIELKYYKVNKVNDTIKN